MSELQDDIKAVDSYYVLPGLEQAKKNVVEAARLVANPVAVKAAVELQDSDGNHQWVVTVLVDRPGDYTLVIPPGDEQ